VNPTSTFPGSPQVIAITGGTAGIGLAIAERFAANGWMVAICGRDQRKLEQAVNLLSRNDNKDMIMSFVVHLEAERSGYQYIEAVAKRFGRIDLLVNNAAVAPLGELSELSEEDIRATLRLNHAAVLETIRGVWPVFVAQRQGLIVNVSSQASIDPFPGFSLYGASKSWLDALTKALAKEGEPHGIRLYSVQPGAVETSLLRATFPDYPAKNTLAPADVAEVVWRLSGPEFRYSSGAAIPIVPHSR
jgi:NAD(P)-dependent dehydrogenase (short-subunit alcohol dehydrogenase family)